MRCNLCPAPIKFFTKFLAEMKGKALATVSGKRTLCVYKAKCWINKGLKLKVKHVDINKAKRSIEGVRGILYLLYLAVCARRIRLTFYATRSNNTPKCGKTSSNACRFSSQWVRTTCIMEWQRMFCVYFRAGWGELLFALKPIMGARIFNSSKLKFQPGATVSYACGCTQVPHTYTFKGKSTVLSMLACVCVCVFKYFLVLCDSAILTWGNFSTVCWHMGTFLRPHITNFWVSFYVQLVCRRFLREFSALVGMRVLPFEHNCCLLYICVCKFVVG